MAESVVVSETQHEVPNIEEYIDGVKPVKTYYSAHLDTGDLFRVEVWLGSYVHFKELVFFEDGDLKGLPDYLKSPIEKWTIAIEMCYVGIHSDKPWVWDKWDIAEGKTLVEAIENFKKVWANLDLKKFLREYLDAPKRLFDTLEEARKYGEALKIRNAAIREMEVIFEEDLDHLITSPL